MAMSNTVISVENLSKRYLLGHESAGETREPYLSLRDVLRREIRNIGRKTLNVSCGDGRLYRATRLRSSGR